VQNLVNVNAQNFSSYGTKTNNNNNGLLHIAANGGKATSWTDSELHSQKQESKIISMNASIQSYKITTAQYE